MDRKAHPASAQKRAAVRIQVTVLDRWRKLLHNHGCTDEVRINNYNGDGF